MNATFKAEVNQILIDKWVENHQNQKELICIMQRARQTYLGGLKSEEVKEVRINAMVGKARDKKSFKPLLESNLKNPRITINLCSDFPYITIDKGMTIRLDKIKGLEIESQKDESSLFESHTITFNQSRVDYRLVVSINR